MSDRTPTTAEPQDLARRRDDGEAAAARERRVPESLPLLLFDGECGFCTWSVEWLARRLVRRTRMLPWQWAPLAQLRLTPEEAGAAIWWFEPGGARFRGAEAAAHALAACRPPWRQAGLALLAPGARSLARAGYALVARVRGRLPGTVPACRQGRPLWGGELRGPG